MRSRRLAGAVALGLVVALGIPVAASAQEPGGRDRVEVYVGTVSPEQFELLRGIGVDPEDVVHGADGLSTEVEVPLTERQAARLASKGVKLEVKRIAGKTSSQLMREQSSRGWSAFRSYSEPGGIRDELTATAARHPKLAKLVTIGRTNQGKPILAVKVTKNARATRDGARPSTVYIGAQHAREWITVEMNRRLLHHVLDSYGSDRAITDLLNRTELWFVPVANPDGYDYTFTEGNRLWRKNLRDNDGDGQITGVDGVDLNRNFDYKWGYDNEGSSPDPSSDTYRGPSPNSEPETRALDGLFRRVRPEFFINYHSAAELLLYGIGWQLSTPSPDDEIYKAMAGDDANPAIAGYDPDISAELYTTNGDTDSYMTIKYGTLGFTPEMTTCETVSASDPDDEWLPENCISEFIFPDDEDLIQAEFAKNIPFALATARSALDPDDPVSVVGRSTPDFVIDPFDVSFGSRQQVAVIARRALSGVKMHYSVNGGRERTAGVREWRGGERYGESHDDYYAEVRGVVPRARPGDKVEVWFSGRKRGLGTVESDSFTYTINADIGGDVLVLAMEDVTGLSPVQDLTTAQFVDEHVAALTAAGYSSDVYDFDIQGREAPHHLGVLSHYRAVLYETGNDIILRAPGQVGGTTMEAALETELNVRDYLNEGGKALVSGKYALNAQGSNGSYFYRPEAPPECTDPDDSACLQLFNDFLQYYLGAYDYVDDGGTDPDGVPYPLSGASSPFEGWSGTLNAPGSAENQDHTASFIPLSSVLPQEEFPWFGPTTAAVDWVRPGAHPFEPFDGDWYAFSGRGDENYKRLTRTVDLTGAAAGELRFNVSHNTEADWDFMIVEAHTVGQDDWTTLPELGGATSTEAGDSCAEGWVPQLHPFLAHYVGEGTTCASTGTTGAWNAVSGSSNGWKEYAYDLTPYAGQQVELSISYVTDWSTEGLGVFVDNVRVSADGAVVATTSFETDLGGWTVPGPPEGSSPNNADWVRTQLGFEEGSVIVTRDTVYAGFGLEGLAPAVRDDFVQRAMNQLIGRPRH